MSGSSFHLEVSDVKKTWLLNSFVPSGPRWTTLLTGFFHLKIWPPSKYAIRVLFITELDHLITIWLMQLPHCFIALKRCPRFRTKNFSHDRAVLCDQRTIHDGWLWSHKTYRLSYQMFRLISSLSVLNVFILSVF